MGDGLAVALLGLLGLILSYLPFGVTLLSVAAAVCGLSGLFAVCFRSVLKPVFQTTPSNPNAVRHAPAFGAICVLLLFLAAVPAVSQAGYTEFAIAADTLPWQRPVAAGEELGLTLEVASSERAADTFEVRVMTEGRVLQAIDLGLLRPGERASRPVSIPPRAHPAQRYDLALIRFATALGERRDHLINSALAASALCTLGLSVAFALGAPLWSPELAALARPAPLALFAAATVAFVVAQLLDSLFVAFQAAAFSFARNLAANVIRLAVVLPALSLMIFAGFTEEVIFRGLLQAVTAPALGRWTLVYVALLFAVLHTGYLSVADGVVFIASVAMKVADVLR